MAGSQTNPIISAVGEKPKNFSDCWDAALESTYNPDGHHDSWRYGFGLALKTNKERNYYNLVEAPFRLCTIIKNIPRLIECLASATQHYLELSYERLKASGDTSWTTQLGLAGITIAWIICFGIKRLSRSFFSPIRSFKDAYKIHWALGILSALTTIGLTILMGMAAAPLLVASGLGSLGSLPGLNEIGEKAAWLFGKIATYSIERAEVAAGAVAGFLLAAILIPLRFVVKKIVREITKKTQKTEVEGKNVICGGRDFIPGVAFSDEEQKAAQQLAKKKLGEEKRRREIEEIEGSDKKADQPQLRRVHLAEAKKPKKLIDVSRELQEWFALFIGQMGESELPAWVTLSYINKASRQLLLCISPDKNIQDKRQPQSYFSEHTDQLNRKKDAAIKELNAVKADSTEKGIKLPNEDGILKTAFVNGLEMHDKLIARKEVHKEEWVIKVLTELEKKDALLKKEREISVVLKKEAEIAERERQAAERQRDELNKQIKEREKTQTQNQASSSIGTPSSPGFQFAGNAPPASGNSNVPVIPSATLTASPSTPAP